VFASVTTDTYNATGGQEPTRYGQILIPRYSLAGIKPQALPAAPAPETKRFIPVPKTMAFVQGGSFTMGSGGDVIRINSFIMGKNEVTEGEYAAVMGKNPSKNPRGANYPVENVSWFDAVEYCNRLSARDGLTPAYTGSGISIQCDFSANGYRLPTEAEWEFAAKGGLAASRLYRYSGGDTLADVGWYQARGQTNRSKHPGGQKKANALGLYDMSGNVYEWCWDWENGESGTGTRRVVRGGAYCYGEAYAEVSSRFGIRPTDWGEYLGFRIARNE
jgi:formylglycine-generating enzyme required for sulfatase activity